MIPVKKPDVLSYHPEMGSNVLNVDYAGGQNHRLLELSESLPVELYRRETSK